MSHALTRPSALRRMATVAFTFFAVLALAIPPAHAEVGLIRAARAIELSGDRTYVRTNLTVTNSAPRSELGVYFGLGEGGETVGVRLEQNGSDTNTRALVAYAYGEFNAVAGENCGAVGFAECKRSGFDWVEDRAYRIELDRGSRNENGWLWTLRIINTANDNVTPLVKVRTQTSQLNATANLAYLGLEARDCSNINSVTGVVTKPRRADGTAFAWGETASYKEGCSGSTAAAPVVDGQLRPRITQ